MPQTLLQQLDGLDIADSIKYQRYYYLTGLEHAMTDQEKQKQPTIDVNEPDEVHDEHPPEQHDRFRETTDKIWGSTKHAWNTATFKANQYKKLVQKKIDLAALHKKIGAAHADLGKLIDDLREEGKKNIMNLAEVREILTRLDELKTEAAALEEEIEQIRTDELPNNEELTEQKNA
jgi:plasmid stabilization system protein ParE